MTVAAAPPQKQSEDLLIGALAVLAQEGVTTLRTNDRSFHEHFGRVLEIFQAAGGEFADLARRYYRDAVSRTYEELDHALITAEQFGLVRFPNPTYSRLQITMTPRVARRLVNEWPDEQQAVLRRAAAVLRESINA